ncbi:MAG: ATP-binding protein [Candidatus Microbacterium stercoravium]
MTRTTNASLSTYEGWKASAERPQREQPALLALAEIESLGERARREYDRRRRSWHANILLNTPQVTAVHEQLWDIINANEQDAGQLRSAAAIDSPPALGKSTAVQAFGRAFHKEEIEYEGEYLDDGHTLYLPVCHISLAGSVTTKALHHQILNFYAHPSNALTNTRGGMTSADLATAAAKSVRRHDTQLIIIDDIHFLNPNRREDAYVVNQLKWIANEYDATLLFAGVGLRERGLLSEGDAIGGAELAQTGRRWTVLDMEPFAYNTKAARSKWRDLLINVEHRLVLADKYPGMLAKGLADYLFARTQGRIGSLMDLIRRGSVKAMRTGIESLDEALLSTVRLDAVAESKYIETKNEIQARRSTQQQRALVREP